MTASTAKPEVNPKRVVTPLARLSYPHLYTPQDPMEEGGAKMYGCELIFPPGTDLSKLKAAATLAARDKWGANPPKGLRTPFRNGDDDREDKDGYEGCVFIGAKSKDRPGVVKGRERLPVMDASEIYGGCYVMASVTAYAYDKKGNKGVAFALNNVLKVRDGEPFGSRQNAEQEFAEVEVDQDAFGDAGFETDSLL